MNNVIGQNTLWDEQVMSQFLKAVQKKGFNLEMLYRAADVEKSGNITVSDFKIFLDKIKQGLPKAKLSRVMYILDENCSGNITEKEFKNTLDAYEVGTEKSKNETGSFDQKVLNLNSRPVYC